MKPRRPYLLRALHEWITDSGETPHIVVDAAAEGVIALDLDRVEAHMPGAALVDDVEHAAFEVVAQHVADLPFVFDDENGGCHGHLLRSSFSPRSARGSGRRSQVGEPFSLWSGAER